jgi:hypothetical protein
MGMAGSTKGGTISGTVRVVGNEPLTHVVVTVAEKTDGEVDYLITGPLGKKLKGGFQGKKVTLEGEFCASPLPQFRKCFRPYGIVQSRDR